MINFNRFSIISINNSIGDIIRYRRVRKESGELLYTVPVTRYGPQSVCQRKRLRDALVVSLRSANYGKFMME